MKLGIADRIMLLNLLPAAGNIVTLRIVADLRRSLSFSEAELADGDITQSDDGRITWDGNAQVEKDVDIGEAATTIIRTALQKLNDEEKLTPALVPTWDRFMG